MRHYLKTLLLSVIIMTMTAGTLWAGKKEDYKQTYNFRRAVELLSEGEVDEAAGYLEQELSEHKDNGYAMVVASYAYYVQDRNGEALSMVNKAMKCLSKKDDFYAAALTQRSKIYVDLGEETQALEDLNTLVKLFSKDPDSFEERARFYLNRDNYSLALADFTSQSALDPGNETPVLGKAVCLRNLDRLEEALQANNQAVKLAPSNSLTQAQRAITYMKCGKYPEASDDIIKALDIDQEDLAFTSMLELSDSAFEVMDFKLKVMQMGQPTTVLWPYCRASILERAKRYQEASVLYGDCQKMEFNPVFLSKRANCCRMFGDCQSALDYIQQSLEPDSTDVDLLVMRASYLQALGRMDEAIAECSHVLELVPDHSQIYSLRSQYKAFVADYDGMIEDATMALLLDAEDASAYYMRGQGYQRKGQKELAEADLRRVAVLDTMPDSSLLGCLALAMLGEREQCLTLLDSTLVRLGKDTDVTKDESILYGKACVYAQLGDKEQALEALKQSLQGDYEQDCYWIEHDLDLESIRGTKRFNKILDEYRSRIEERLGKPLITEDPEGGYELKVSEVPFTHEGGVTKVKCRINDLPLHFVFDTGASDVSISTVEATFMLKNGYLSEKDIIGQQTYMTADGSISAGTTIVLRKVIFGDLELDDIKASVVNSQKAPLLLGQTVLQRLGKIEIDNSRNVLVVSQRVQTK